jgi:Protein of unknown function (DUF1566)
LSWSKQLENSEWEAAKARCDGLTYNGQSGWRLPKIEDLTNAVKHHIETTQSDVFVQNFNKWFWSDSSEHFDDIDEESIKRPSRDAASFVNLKDGIPKDTNTESHASVICVR